MKKFVLTLMAMLTLQLSASAMSYEQARDQALFLTDKMAYELNLTEDQYEAAYEINLDYLMRVNTVDDLYGVYWTRRNLDLSYIMFDWQYNMYCAASYFYRPLWWDAGYWHFGIYARYPRRSYFYFGRPAFVVEYRGGHSWYNNGGHSWYNGRHFGRGGERNGRYFGMRDGFQRGEYRNGFGNGRRLDTTVRNNGGQPTRPQQGGATVQNRGFGNGSRGATTMGNRTTAGFGNRNQTTTGSTATPNRNVGRLAVTPNNNVSRSTMQQSQSRITRGSSTRATVGSPRNEMSTSGIGSSPSRSFSPSTSSRSSSRLTAPSPSSRSYSSPSRSYSAPSRSYSAPSSSFEGSRSSFGGGSSSRGFGGGGSSSRSFGGGGGGHSFGGHR